MMAANILNFKGMPKRPMLTLNYQPMRYCQHSKEVDLKKSKSIRLAASKYLKSTYPICSNTVLTKEPKEN